MKSRTTTTYAVALAIASALALAGCNGGDEDPAPSPTASTSSTTSPSASPSASPTPTASPTSSASTSIDIPAAARANTDAGAIAFVKFWFAQVNVANEKMNPAIVDSLSADSCRSCAGIAGEIRDLIDKGQRLSGPPLAPVSNPQIVAGSIEGERRVSFTLTQRASDIVDASGTVVDKQEAGTARRVALVSWEGDRWTMEGLADES